VFVNGNRAAPHDNIEGGIVHLPSAAYGVNFHEYAHGAADWALDNENGPDTIQTGNA
jgi:hypothetical protein